MTQMIRLEYIIEELRSYMPDADFDMIWKAYAFAAKCHKGQKRVSGEPYLSHPLEVANILTQMKLGHVSVSVGLLHDTVEDYDTTVEEIEELFGDEVAHIVDGVTKLSLLQFSSKEEQQAENFRKMILAMSKDLRVILIKLADRTHNMRTLNFLRPEKQRAIAQETLDIYAPLANRLGIGWIKTELENNAFKYLWPKDYYEIRKKVKEVEGKRDEYIKQIVDDVKEYLSAEGFKVEVAGRPKNYYSIFSKIYRQGISFDEVLDLMGIRIITQTKEECYTILGHLHTKYKPIPGKLDDYIALPKANMYQSLHTTTVGPEGKPVEFQIRTRAMHAVSEEGIAAHWRYKDGVTKERKHDDQIIWLRRLMDWQQDVKDPREFLEFVKIDLFPDEVYVFTPQQDVKALPQGATPIDFAYAVHTDVGHHCIGAKVNGKLSSLRQELKNGDIVEVLTSVQSHPNRDWLKFVKTSKARTKISHYIHQAERERGLELGKELFEKELTRLGLETKKYMTEEMLLPHAQSHGYMSLDSMYIAIGLGKVKVSQILAKVAPRETASAYKKKMSLAGTIKKLITKPLEKAQTSGVRIQGMDDLLIRFAQCCNPVPGDEIRGFISRGRGLIVHTVDCPNAVAIGLRSERSVDVEWDIKEKEKEKRLVMVKVNTENKPGILSRVSGIIAEHGSNISEASVRADEGSHGNLYITLDVFDLAQLRRLMEAIDKLPGVKSVERIKDRSAFQLTRAPKKSN